MRSTVYLRLLFSALLRMLLVCVRSYLKSLLKYKFLIFCAYHLDTIYEVCPENSRIYRVKIFQSYLEAIQPCRLQSTPLYSVCTATSVSAMF